MPNSNDDLHAISLERNLSIRYALDELAKKIEKKQNEDGGMTVDDALEMTRQSADFHDELASKFAQKVSAAKAAQMRATYPRE